MQNNKPQIVFTFPATLGGVSSFNYNIINNSLLIKNFHSKVILLKEKNDTRPLFTEIFLVDEQILFEYNANENQYHLQKRLSNLLGNAEGAIVTDNGMTVEAARRFNNPKTIFNLIHDYYYVNQQTKLQDWSDVVIAHSSFFSDAVFASNPELYVNRSLYIPYGVKQLSSFAIKENKKLNLVFLGRLEESKGVKYLIDIQNKLKNNDVSVNWTIIGKGSLANLLKGQWKEESVLFCEPKTTEEVYKILKRQDVFVFPTMFEGTPVSILEALACGVVTIVNDLPGGIRDIVKDGIGFKCSLNNIDEFVEYIKLLNNDRILLSNMQQNCFLLANEKYDIEKNSELYFNVFFKYKELKRVTKSPSKKLLKLDNAFVPNYISKIIRSLK